MTEAEKREFIDKIAQAVSSYLEPHEIFASIEPLIDKIVGREIDDAWRTVHAAMFGDPPE
ncbi:MAG: hypothetical protein ACREC9_12405 [Methylocella sp.]